MIIKISCEIITINGPYPTYSYTRYWTETKLTIEAHTYVAIRFPWDLEGKNDRDRQDFRMENGARAKEERWRCNSLLPNPSVKIVNEPCEEFRLANKNRKTEKRTRLKGTARVHVLINFDCVD